MYKLKPVFQMPLEIQNTSSMYKLKNLHEKAIGNVLNRDINDDILLSEQEIDLLIKKQNEILKTFEQLEIRLSKLDKCKFHDADDDESISKKQPDSLTPCHMVKKNDLKVSGFQNTNNNSIINMIKTDTVIFADPENPPYLLLALPILWPEVPWDISYHVHSSLTVDLKALKSVKLFKNLSCKDNNKKTVKVFVIWQYIKPSLKIVRSSTEVFFGEVSLLLLFDQYFSTEKSIADNQRNSAQSLDLINEISCSTNDRTSELYNLIDTSNTKLNIENIVLWSLLNKKNNTPPNIEKWLSMLSKIILS